MTSWRRLPVPLAPAQQETLASWLHRLATVHGLVPADLRHHLRIGPYLSDDSDERRGLVRRLAAVTGHAVERLAWALPELRMPAPEWPALRHLAQRACPRCTARHQGGPVRRPFAHHEYLCVRHGYWVGPPDPTRDDPPPQLAGRLPELVTAQLRLHRAARHHGWAATFDATAAATSICVNLRFSAEHHPLWTRWQRRLDLLMPASYRRSLFIAAIYPEVCALAAVLADWHTPAPTDRPSQDGLGVDHIIAAAERALGGSDTLPRAEVSSALLTWLTTRASGPLLGPTSIYPETSHHDDGTPRITDTQRQAEQGTANRFVRDRRAPRTHRRAAPLPYAHRPAAASASAGRSS
jgi:TniQ